MKHPTFAATAILALGLVLAPAAARAQTPEGTPAAPDEDLQRLFDEGVRFLADGDYVRAEERLERARALRELPAILYDLALAQRGRGRILAALASLDRYLALAQARGPLEPSRRADVDALRTALRASLGHVTLRASLPGIEVRMDAAALTAAQRATVLDVDPGTHVFRASGADYEPVEVSREVHAGESVTVILAPEPRDVVTALHVTPSLANAEVLLDGFLVGTGELTRRVRPGPHRLEARANGFERWSARLSLAPGAQTTMRADLVRVVPLHEQWWFWTGVGVLVVGGIVAAVIAATSGPVECTVTNGPCIPVPGP